MGLFEDYEKDDFLYINGQANTERIALSDAVDFSNELLQHWENSVFVHNPNIRMTGFYLRKTAARSPEFLFSALSPHWTGEISVGRTRDNSVTTLYSSRIESSYSQAAHPRMPKAKVSDVPSFSTENLLGALDGLVTFITGSVNETQPSPVRGGFHLFYDMDAGTYRVPHWMWTWGVPIKLLLEADTRRADLAISSEQDLAEVAARAGRRTLDFLERDPSHPASGLITVRWNTRLDTERGFQQYLSPADTHFLVGWGWIPLYEKTGDKAFLEAATLATEAESRLVAEFGVPGNRRRESKTNRRRFYGKHARRIRESQWALVP